MIAETIFTSSMTHQAKSFKLILLLLLLMGIFILMSKLSRYICFFHYSKFTQCFTERASVPLRPFLMKADFSKPSHKQTNTSSHNDGCEKHTPRKTTPTLAKKLIHHVCLQGQVAGCEQMILKKTYEKS